MWETGRSRPSTSQGERPQKKSTLPAPLKKKKRIHKTNKKQGQQILISKNIRLKKIIEFKTHLPDSQGRSKEIHRVT